MSDLSGFGKILILSGGILAIMGLLFTFAGKIPWVGRLPGDIYIKKENFSFYLPLATCILLSIGLSLILFFIGRRR
ncbi:MAG: DUF2905 domain-containing protein [Candidatus Omnitrophica bacterium]|nr:DUF2905 domain-containing protein [Candidatus Omnitrophota bacterium]